MSNALRARSGSVLRPIRGSQDATFPVSGRVGETGRRPTARNGSTIRPPSRRSVIGRSARASTVSCSIATRSSRGPASAGSSRACPWGRGDCTTSARKPGGNNPAPGTIIWRAASLCCGRDSLWRTFVFCSRKVRRAVLSPPCRAAKATPRIGPVTTSTAARRRWCSRA